jgi:hypothetical protein
LASSTTVGYHPLVLAVRFWCPPVDHAQSCREIAWGKKARHGCLLEHRRQGLRTGCEADATWAG